MYDCSLTKTYTVSGHALFFEEFKDNVAAVSFSVLAQANSKEGEELESFRPDFESARARAKS